MKLPEQDVGPTDRRASARGAAADPPPAAAPPARRPPKSRRGWATLLVGLALLCAGAWYWQRGGAAEPKPQAAAQPASVPVEVAEAQTAEVPIHLNGLGTAQAFNTVLVKTRVDGEIVKIAFQEGQMVREGEVLAQIDPRPYQAALDGAIAKKVQDEATLAATRADLERTRKLASQSFATQQQLDQQTASVAAQEAQIQADQAAIDNARTQLDYTTIRSPLTGRTGLRLIDQGNIVRAADTTGIVEVAQLQPISVLFTAPESQLAAIRAAENAGPVEVTALAPDGRGILGTGRLALINNEVDPATGTVRLKATFGNEEGRLWPGLSVNTRLLVKILKGVVAVPEAAIQRGPSELFAFVAGPDGKAEKRVLTVGPITAGVAVVEDGLRPGERVVTAGQSRVIEGARLEILAPRAAPKGGGAERGRMAETTGSTGPGRP